jgi:deoxyribonuclease IV
MPAQPAETRLRNPVGTHVRVGTGLVRGALAQADAIGAETIQVFVGNPRGWAASPGDPVVDAAFRDACAAAGRRVFVHTPYLVNLGSPTTATYQRSVATVAHNLRRAAEIGAEGVVVHTGSCVDDGLVTTALRQVREGLLPVLDALGEDGPWLLLEPTAGQGFSLCSQVRDLGPYFDVLGRHPKLGVCLDTCHVFAAGHDLAAPGGVKRTLDELESVTGPGRLRLIHANDSKDVAGAHKDRHANIGAGHIGDGPFADLMTHPATEGVPFIIETPGRKPGHAADVARLKELRDGGS